MLAAARAVVTTSEWSRRWLLGTTASTAARVHVAEPGVDPADARDRERVPGRDCSASPPSRRDKGHDVLLAALAEARRPAVAAAPAWARWPATARRSACAAAPPRRAASPTGSSGRAADPRRARRATPRPTLLVLADARRELRDGGHRGAGARGAGDGDRGRRGARGARRSRGGRGAGAGRTTLPRWPARCAAGSRTRRCATTLRAAARSRRTTLTGWPVTAAKVAAVLDEVAR